VNRIPTPDSLPSSHGSGNLEIDLAPSPRLLLFLAAWGAAAAAAVLDCGACGTAGRAGLLGALAAALAVGGARLLPLPRSGGVRRLRHHGGQWWALAEGGWEPVGVAHAVEVLRAGWWLQLRGGARRGHWVWVDAGGTPRAAYRALCRELRRAGVRGGEATPGSALRTGASIEGPDPRRLSRREREPPP
jgi:hypothetical protein